MHLKSDSRYNDDDGHDHNHDAHDNYDDHDHDDA
jgi:hypothetical protein